MKARLQQSSTARRLADRELDVLLLIARGETNKEIGATLGISSKTAQHHVAHAYRTNRVSSRVDAALWLTVRGIGGSDSAERLASLRGFTRMHRDRLSSALLRPARPLSVAPSR